MVLSDTTSTAQAVPAEEEQAEDPRTVDIPPSLFHPNLHNINNINKDSSSGQEEPIHALDKYSNLQSEIEKVRHESSLRRGDLSTLQQELQDLHHDRESMIHNVQISQQSEESWKDKSIHIQQNLLHTMKEQHLMARNRRECAEHVRNVTKNRIDDSHRNMEQSRNTFHDACHRLLHGVKRQQDSSSTCGSSESLPSPSRRLQKTGEGSDNETTTSCKDAVPENPSLTILQTDWWSILNRVWSDEAAEAAAVAATEKRDDVETLPTGTSIQEESSEVPSLSVDHDTSATESPQVMSRAKKDGPTSPEIKASVTDEDCEQLFQTFMKQIQTVDKMKDSEIIEAEARLTKAQSRYDQMVRLRDELLHEHELWSNRVHRQQVDNTNLANQLDRIQKDIVDLQDQLESGSARNRSGHVESTDIDRVHGPSKTNGHFDNARKRLRSTEYDDLSHRTSVANGVANHRNPYIKSKPVTSGCASDTTIPRPISRPTDTSGGNRHPKAHAVISPVVESSLSNNIPGEDNQHPHRMGRIRGARGFGVSLSLHDVSASLNGPPSREPHASVNANFSVDHKSTIPQDIERLEEGDESDVDHVKDSVQTSLVSTPRAPPKDRNDRSKRTHRDLPVVSTAKAIKARTSAVFADDSSEDDGLSFAFRK